MPLREIVLDPPFNTTRISHVILTVHDLDASRRFYSDVLGMITTAQDSDALYLRGVEEACHHSLVLRRSGDAQVCLGVGYRVLSDADLDPAKAFFDARSVPARWIDAPHQGRTLQVTDATGAPMEFCATMTSVPRLMQAFDKHHGGSPLRLDHVQIAASDIQAAYDFYAALGFRLTEYTAKDGTEELWGVWLQRKGNPHDVVFSNGRGPRLHHFAYAVPEVGDLIHACDVAASTGYASHMERGPGRHGIGNALFVYFRDPDGHRIELFNTHYQAIDPDEKPMRWDLSNTSRSQLWGLPATRRWFMEATHFAGVEPSAPILQADPVTLETFLANQA